MSLKFTRLPWLAALFGWAAAWAHADTVAIAAAANLTFVIDALNAEFRRTTPDVTLNTTLGASGNLSAQIRNGAPFDVFLSADTHYPRELARSGHGDATTLQTFAVGRLVLWTTRTDLDTKDIAAVIRAPSVRKVAVAQPQFAPYGQAACAALEKLGLQAEARPKLVEGENIAQTAQFVETGNADAGFVALSFVLSPRLAGRGHWTEIPPRLFAPVSLAHGCVLTRHGTNNDVARKYLVFLQSPAARKILEAHGYSLPP